MEKILFELEKFGFSKIDALTYVTILKNPKINGSQVAKKINVPRTSVYSSLENLYQKGAIHLIQGSTNTYIAKNPVDFIKKIKIEYNNSADYLENEFATFECSPEAEDFVNIKGNKNAIEKIKEMLSLAKKEVYINTNYDLDNFKEELESARQRDVRIILFTFRHQDFNKYGIEEYYNEKFFSCGDKYEDIKRTMLVIDCSSAFIGSGKTEDDFFATFSYNRLFVKIISEHIHHDIYLLGLEKLYGTDWFNKLKLGTLHELGQKY